MAEDVKINIKTTSDLKGVEKTESAFTKLERKLAALTKSVFESKALNKFFEPLDRINPMVQVHKDYLESQKELEKLRAEKVMLPPSERGATSLRAKRSNPRPTPTSLRGAQRRSNPSHSDEEWEKLKNDFKQWKSKQPPNIPFTPTDPERMKKLSAKLDEFMAGEEEWERLKNDFKQWKSKQPPNIPFTPTDPERMKKLSAKLDEFMAGDEEWEKLNQRKEADAASLRESAAEDRKKAQSLFGSETTAVTQSKADIVRIDKSTADAKAQMEANQKRRAEEAAKKKAEETARADALARQNAADKETIETGNLSITHLQDQLRANELAQQEAQGAYENERMDVFRAQNNLSLFNTQNAGRKGASINRQRTALQEKLHKETEEMHAAETELNKTMNTLASTIQSLKKQLAEVQAKVNQAVSRQNAATDAEPAGE